MICNPVQVPLKWAKNYINQSHIQQKNFTQLANSLKTLQIETNER